jgi:hypothetical protein
VKKLFFSVAAVVLFLTTFSSPLQLKTDGNPNPQCPTGMGGCKPNQAV